MHAKRKPRRQAFPQLMPRMDGNHFPVGTGLRTLATRSNRWATNPGKEILMNQVPLADAPRHAGAAAPTPFDLKVLIVGRRRPGTTATEHRHHIRHVHGELVLGYIGAEPANAPRRYVQNAVIDGQFRALTPGPDTLSLGCDFVTQVWFPDFPALHRSRATPYFMENIQGDEANFVDAAAVSFFPVRERTLHGSAQVASGSWKVFGFVQRAPSSDPARFAQAWAKAADALRKQPEGSSVRRHVQNDVLSKPDAPALADGIDEFWLDDEAAARSLLRAWQMQLEAALVSTGLAVAGSLVAMIAREDIVFAGVDAVDN
jgi:hypothetical protein